MCVSVPYLYNLCFHYRSVCIQPERLNAEGDSPSALSRGLSVSATPGIPTTPKEKRLNDAKAAAKASDIRVLRITVGVTIPRVTLRSTPG